MNMTEPAVLQPQLTYLCRIRAEVDPVVSLGSTVYGERRYVPIIGGTVTGDTMKGRVLRGGVDWQLQRSDGTLDIAAHYVIQTEDGATIEISSKGYRHGPADVMRRLAAGEQVNADEYYFRTAITFLTSAAHWQSLNSAIALGLGTRHAGAAIIDVYQVR